MADTPLPTNPWPVWQWTQHKVWNDCAEAHHVWLGADTRADLLAAMRRVGWQNDEHGWWELTANDAAIVAERAVAAAEREGAEKDALLARADNLLGHASHSYSRCEPPDGRSMESWCSVCSWREDLAAASPLPETGDTQ